LNWIEETDSTDLDLEFKNLEPRQTANMMVERGMARELANAITKPDSELIPADYEILSINRVSIPGF